MARLQPRKAPEWGVSGEDADVRYNLWWEDRGVNTNDIMPLFTDPVSGGAAMAFAVRVEQAKAGDNYGDVRSDLGLHEAYFKKAAELL